MRYPIELLRAATTSLLLILAFFVVSCASQEILPDKVEVKVSRDEPGKDCKMIGPVTGSVSTIGDSSEVSMVHLKQDAARKGANYVHYETSSADGSGLKGTAYYCR